MPAIDRSLSDCSYSDAMDIVWSVIGMAFSSAVITPGVTTCDDVGWWMWEAVRAAGYTWCGMPLLTDLKCHY